MHRVLSLVACLLMLYVGVTGSCIQAIDLATPVSFALEVNPAMTSINEGKFGNGYCSAVEYPREVARLASRRRDHRIGPAGARRGQRHRAWLREQLYTFAPRLVPRPHAAMTDSQVLRVANATCKALRGDEPGTPVKVIRGRVTSGLDEGAVIGGGHVARQRVSSTATAEEMHLSELQDPDSAFPLGMNVHDRVKHFHLGYLFDLAARFLDLPAGPAVIFLSASRLWMYFRNVTQAAPPAEPRRSGSDRQAISAAEAV